MRLDECINSRLDSEDINSDTMVIVQTDNEETICALTAADLLDSDADCLSMEVFDSEIDDNEDLVVVVE